MTESAYFSSAAQKDCFNELDVERYEVVETLDRSTCETCGEMDGKVFKMSEFQVGATAPPFHPWCRGCTAPYFEDMACIGARHARDAVTGEGYSVPSDMTYKEWKAQQDAKYGSGTVDKMRKMKYNETADREQFKQAYPNATVNIISGKRGYNGSASGNKTWKYRKKVTKHVK